MATRRSSARFMVALALAAGIFATAAGAQDSVTVGTVTATGTVVDVPIYIRDAAGTPLGMDQPPGSKIQSFSIKVEYSPASSVQSIAMSRAGITASLTPTSEFTPSGAGFVSILDTFSESTNLIPFTLNKAAPGDLVAHLVVTLSGSAIPGSTVTLHLDPALTQLTDQGGGAATKETTANGQLVLVDGAISVPELAISLAPTSLVVPLGESASVSVTASSSVVSSTLVSLAASNGNVSIPSSVIIAAGYRTATFDVSGVSVGQATITATLGGSVASTLVSVSDCRTPSAPIASAPSSVLSGETYDLTWNAVEHATEYQVYEATNAAFTGAVSKTVAGTRTSFSHDEAGVRYYYRVRARDGHGSCDALSSFSTTVSVLIGAIPVPEQGVLAVAGSLQGGFGSFFRTSVRMFNPYESTISGKIVFHPAGLSGSATDPSLSYSIPPGATISFANLLPALGVSEGIGSIDLVAEGSSKLPIMLARVFNDGGAAGTTGFAVESLTRGDALAAGSRAVLIAPTDALAFRLNVGIRTLDDGATLVMTVRDANGTVVASVEKSYPPNLFSQVGAAALLDGYALKGGETITFAVKAGSAFVYGATTDNTTNDPSLQFARPIQ